MSEERPRFTTLSSHSGAAFERGEVHGRNERPMSSGGYSDGHEPEEGFGGGGGGGGGSGGSRGIRRFLSGGGNGADEDAYQNGRRVRQKAEPETSVVNYKGTQLTVFKGTHAAEDPRWVLITEVKDNGTKTYKCVGCGWSRTCKIGVVIEHLLRTKGSVCPKLPSEEMQDKLSRHIGGSSSASAALSTAVKSPAVGKTAGILASGFSKHETATADVDMALAKFISTFDLSWAAFDSRNPLWVDVVKKIKLAGPAYKPAPSEVLSCHNERSDGSRPGGLYLADQTCKRERREVLASTMGEPSLGGTLVSDGAKIKTKKRSYGMNIDF